MTDLRDRLLARIAREGPLSVADYMLECLLDPKHGYYATRDPLGAAGDFTTAPEISQMFGELLGLWLAQVWMDQGAPDGIVLAELGPGRGTLMADLLRATKGVPGFHAALHLHLVEASPVLRAAQAQALGPFSPLFHDSLSDLPEGPLYLVANEFFDALPIRQFQRGPHGWHERQIGAKEGRLIWGLAPETRIGQLEPLFEATPEGAIVETNAAATAIAAEIGHRVATHGGAALIIDYGDLNSQGDTFQAVARHAYADPLDTPGAADLTAHVAFAPLARAAAPAQASALVTQGVFLERLGITARARILAQSLGGAALDAHIAAHRRLTHPQEMGTLFKVLALTPPDTPAPPALEA